MKNIKGVLSSISSISLAIFLPIAAIFVGIMFVLGTFICFIVWYPIELEPGNFDIMEFTNYFVRHHIGYSLLGGLVIPFYFIRVAIRNFKCIFYDWSSRQNGGFDNDAQRESAIKVTVNDFIVAVLLLSVAIAIAVIIPIKDALFYLVFYQILIMGIVAFIGSVCKISLVRLQVKPQHEEMPREELPDPWSRR